MASKDVKLLNSFVEYFGEVKPYHSKLKEFTSELFFNEDPFYLSCREDHQIQMIHKGIWSGSDPGGESLSRISSGSDADKVFRIPATIYPRFSLNDSVNFGQTPPGDDPASIDFTDANLDGIPDSEEVWTNDPSQSHFDSNSEAPVHAKVLTQDVTITSASELAGVYTYTYDLSFTISAEEATTYGFLSSPVSVYLGDDEVTLYSRTDESFVVSGLEGTYTATDDDLGAMPHPSDLNVDLWAKYGAIKQLPTVAVLWTKTRRFPVPFHQGSRVRIDNVPLIFNSDYTVNKARSFIQILSDSLLERAAPALEFNFVKNQSLLSASKTVTLEFTRSGVATRVNSHGIIEEVPINTPRWDFDPATLECKGLLVEGSRANVGVNSSSVQASGWIAAASTDISVTENTDVAPDNTLTADTITDSSAVATGRLQSNVATASSATARCLSWFVKKTVGDVHYGAISALYTSGGTNVNALITIDTNTGEITDQTVDVTDSGVINFGAYWRFWVTVTDNSSGNTVLACQFFPAYNTTGTATGSNPTTGSKVVWGRQVEVGLFPSSYIPTTSITVTRGMDIPTISNISGFYNPLEGTVVVEVQATDAPQTNDFARTFAFTDGTGAEQIAAYRYSSLGRWAAIDNSVNQAVNDTGAWADGTVARVAIGFKANDFATSMDGSSVVVDATGTLPTVDRLDIGHQSSASAIYGWVRNFMYYSQRLSNSDLESLSGGADAFSPVKKIDVNLMKVDRLFLKYVTPFDSVVHHNFDQYGYDVLTYDSSSEDPETGDADSFTITIDDTYPERYRPVVFHNSRPDVIDKATIQIDAIHAGALNGEVYTVSAIGFWKFKVQRTAPSLGELEYADFLKPFDNGKIAFTITADWTPFYVTNGPAPADVEAGTLQSATDSTAKLRPEASLQDDVHNNMSIRLLTGPGSIQQRPVADYNGATKVVTIDGQWAINGLTKSSRIEHPNWVKENGIIITPNFVEGPDGTLKAARAQFSSGTLQRYWHQMSGYSGKIVTFALQIRSLTGVDQAIAIYIREIGFLTTYGTSGFTVTPEWQRFSVTAVIPPESTAVMALVYNSGAAVWDIAVCEHQWNEGETPRDFIETDVIPITIPDSTTTYELVEDPALQNAYSSTLGFQSDPTDFLINLDLKTERGVVVDPQSPTHSPIRLQQFGKISKKTDSVTGGDHYTFTLDNTPFKGTYIELRAEQNGQFNPRMNLSCTDSVSITQIVHDASQIHEGVKRGFGYVWTETPEIDDAITFVRNTPSTIVDWEGVVKSVLPGEVRFEGYRRVRNILTNAENFATWTINQGGAAIVPTVTPNFGIAPDGTRTAARVQLSLNGGTTTSDFSTFTHGTISTNSARFSVWVKTNDNTEKVVMLRATVGGDTSVTIDGTWKRFSHNVAVALTQVGVWLRGGQTPTNSDTADVLVWHPQVEEVTSQTNTNPSEYVSPNSQYGAGANGVKYFTYENGNVIQQNFIPRSQEFSAVGWTVANVSVTNDTTVAPDGTTTADTLTASFDSACRVWRTGSGTMTYGVVYTSSAYFKPGTANGFISFDNGGGVVYAWIKATLVGEGSYELGGLDAGLIKGSVTLDEQGFYRVTLTWRNSVVSGAGTAFGVWDGTANVSNYPGTLGGKTVTVWGAQLQPGYFASGYVPSSGSTINVDGIIEEHEGPRLNSETVIKGLSTWDTRVNLVLQSENFGTTWSPITAPTRTAAAARCGDVILDLIEDDSAVNPEGYLQAITFTGDGTKSISFFFKESVGNFATILLQDSTVPVERGRVTISWSAGVPTVTPSSGAVLEGVESLANGVYRAKFQVPGVVAANSNTVNCYGATSGTTGSIYIGGVQVENSDVCSPYIPTTTTIGVKDPDSLTISDISSFYNPIEGTLALEGLVSFSDVGGRAAVSINDGSSQQEIYLGRVSNGRLLVINGGVIQANVGATGFSGATATIPQIEVAAWAEDDFANSINGTTALTDNSGTLPVVSNVTLGGRVANPGNWNGHLRKVAYYPTRFSNEILESYSFGSDVVMEDIQFAPAQETILFAETGILAQADLGQADYSMISNVDVALAPPEA